MVSEKFMYSSEKPWPATAGSLTAMGTRGRHYLTAA